VVLDSAQSDLLEANIQDATTQALKAWLLVDPALDLPGDSSLEAALDKVFAHQKSEAFF